MRQTCKNLNVDACTLLDVKEEQNMNLFKTHFLIIWAQIITQQLLISRLKSEMLSLQKNNRCKVIA